VPRADERKSHVYAKQLRRNLTHAEVILWQCLRRNSIEGLRFRRQHPIGPYVADFACLPVKLVVEVDGATHGSDAQLAYDARRRGFMQRYGWREIRVSNHDVYKNLSNVLEYIWREATSLRAPSTASRSPSPAEAGEDVRCGD
jgi:very-short-patch-repair endonuclease